MNTIDGATSSPLYTNANSPALPNKNTSFGELNFASKTIVGDNPEEDENDSDKEQYDLKHSSKEYIAA